MSYGLRVGIRLVQQIESPQTDEDVAERAFRKATIKIYEFAHLSDMSLKDRSGR